MSDALVEWVAERHCTHGDTMTQGHATDEDAYRHVNEEHQCEGMRVRVWSYVRRLPNP